MKITKFVRGGVYIPPSIERIDIRVERGFAISGSTMKGIPDLDEEDYEF